MRTIERSSTFKKDYKRVKSTPRHRKNIDALLRDCLVLLCSDQPLPEGCRDHGLTGNWNGYRECHLKPDLLLIYRMADNNTLRLARLGSHSELFK
ncbi:type II toxin-antitoxin system YafQ family toxin [Desulfobacterales bacterium HSG17]|nr:type II toxin-antitoxin system YafQ family toxin [Desulfobacterales bacterium HSG17]